MNTRFFTTSFLLLLAGLLHAQSIQIPAKQIPVVTKIAADWCPPCGGWGWSFYDGAYQDNSANALVWTIHHSGGLTNPTANKLAHNFLIIGQPEFYLNMGKRPVNSSNYTTYLNTLKTDVDNLAGQSPLAQSGLIAAHADDQLKVVTKTRFFNATEGGEYRIGIYLVEKSYFGYQQSQGNNAHHKQLFRRALTSNDYGMLLSDQAIDAGTEFSLETAIPWSEVSAYTQSNLRVATIIWKKDGNRYLVVNANFTDNIQDGLVATNEPTDPKLALQVRPNPVEGAGQLWLKSPSKFNRLTVEILDRAGRKVRNVFDGPLPAGENTLPFSVEGLPSGSYLIRAAGGLESISSWVVVK